MAKKKTRQSGGPPQNSTNAPDRAMWPTFAILGVAAFVLRCVFVYLAHTRNLFPGLFLDSRYYAEMAASIRTGHGAGAHPYLMSPLYPYLLALFTDFSGTLAVDAVRVFQALIDSGTVIAVAGLAWRVAGRRAAWIAGAAAALYAPMIDFTGMVLVETPQAFLFTLAVLCLAWDPVDEPRRVWRWLVGGAAMGLGAALRPTLLAVAPAIVAMEVLAGWRTRRNERGPRALVPVGVFVAAIAVVIAPFAARNVVRGHEGVLLSANGGFNFYVGNNAEATGVFHLPEAVDPFHDVLGKSYAEQAVGHALTYREAAAWWRSRALADMVANPARWTGLMVKKTALMLHPVEIPQLGESFHSVRRRAWPLRFPLDARSVFLLAALWPLAAPDRRSGRQGQKRERPGRTLLTWLRDPSPMTWVAASIVVYFAAVVLFFVNARYRLPVMPLVLVPAAATVDALFASRLSSKRSRWAVGLLAVMMVTTQFVFYGPLAVASESAADRRHQGMALYDQGRYAEAVEVYRQALAEGDSPITRNNLANALKKLGRFDEARAEYERALAANPRDAVTWFNLGNLRREHDRDWAGALDAYDRAIASAPRMAAAHFNRGVVLAELGRRDEARAAFDAVIQNAKATSPLIEQARRAIASLSP